MSARVSREKIDRLQALADERGVISGIGAAHRGSLRRAIVEAKGVGPDDVTDEMMREVKLGVSKALTPHASAILLDPEWGLPAAEARAKGAGLLLCYEQSGYDHDRPGRRTDLLPDMSARRLKELGADAVKLLLYYSPFEDTEINDQKHALVERVGAECRAVGLPFFLELAAYDEHSAEGGGLEQAKRKPQIVTGGIRELSKERYGVDILGVDVPVNLEFARGSSSYSGQTAYSKEQALECYRAAAEAAELPFVFLSAEAPAARFTEALQWAAEAGVNFAGALGGRAFWAGGMPVYGESGVAAFEEWLSGQAVKSVDAVNATLANAGSWYSFYGAASADDLAE